MDTFPSSPPAAVRADLAALRASLDTAPIPFKTLDRNVLIGTWNIRGFGRVSEKWQAEANDSPKRNLRDVLCLAEIVSRFDVVALQEVKRDLAGLRRLMQALGPNWGWTLTDLTRGDAGGQERMAFLFDLRRVRPSGLAAELVVPIETETSLTETKLEKQFARTPYAVSFECRERPSPSSRSMCCGATTPPRACRRSPRSPTGCATGPTAVRSSART